MISITKPETVKLKFESPDELVSMTRALNTVDFPTARVEGDPKGVFIRIGFHSWETCRYKLIQKASFPNPGKNQITLSKSEATALLVVLSRTESADPYVNNVFERKKQELSREVV